MSKTHHSGVRRVVRFVLMLTTLLALVPARSHVTNAAAQVSMSLHTAQPSLLSSLVPGSDDTSRTAPIVTTQTVTATHTFTGTTNVRSFLATEAGIDGEPEIARTYHTSTRLADGRVLIAGGLNNSTAPNRAELFDPATGTFSIIGPLIDQRYWHTATRLQDGQVLLVGGQFNAGVVQAELFDPMTNTFTATGQLHQARWEHTATLLPDGKVLIAGGIDENGAVSSAELYDPATHAFTLTGAMVEARSEHTATILQNNTVLIAGGHRTDLSDVLASAEIYDPSSGTFTTTASLNSARFGHRATRLIDGRVLITGGKIDSIQGIAAYLSSAEIYTPSTGTFARTGTMQAAHMNHTTTLLQNGYVLITGGRDSNGPTKTAELYDPASGTFATTGMLQQPRDSHTSTLLENGQVLLVGGGTSGSTSQKTAELYNPGRGTFTGMSRKLPTGIFWNTATKLPNGTVLIAGGEVDGLVGAYIYDSHTNGFTPTGSMKEARGQHTGTLLRNGKVLIAGGTCSAATAELYDPATGTFSYTGSMRRPRANHTATMMQDGKVLLTGGQCGSANYKSAEIYDPTTGTFSETGSMSAIYGGHAGALLPNGDVLIVGEYQAERYDLTTGQWFATKGYKDPRAFTTATVLTDGTVLIAGGFSDDSLYDAQVYNPATNTFTPTGKMHQLRINAASVRLEDGTVMVVGGSEGSNDIEVYDLLTRTFQVKGSTLNRQSLTTTAVRLEDGSIFVMGDQFSPPERIRRPIRNTFSATLTVPTGWVTTATPAITFTATTTGTAVNAGSVNVGPWITTQPNTLTSATLPATTDGHDRPVMLRLRDAESNISTVVTGTIDVDTTDPASTLQALPTTSPRTFTIGWSGDDATSGVAAYDLQVRANNGAWTPVLTRTSVLSTTFTGDQGTTYGFRVRAIDAAGNVESWSVSPDTQTQVDAIAPEQTVRINGGALATTSTAVTLTLAVSDTQSIVSDIRISQEGTVGVWQPYTRITPVTLPSGDGPKTIVVEVRDSVGNVSEPVSQTIRLDTTSGTNSIMTINNAALYTNTPTVTLHIGASAGTWQMKISNDGSFPGAEWQPFDTTAAWTITTFGRYTLPRTVYVRTRTIDGTERALSDDIIFDPLPPEGSVTITSVNTSSVNVRLSADDEISNASELQMRVGTDPRLTGAAWQPYKVSATVPHTSSSTPQVYAQFEDGAGNRSDVACAAPNGQTCATTDGIRVFLPLVRK